MFPHWCFGVQAGSPVGAGLGAALGAHHVLWRWPEFGEGRPRLRRRL